MIVAAFWMVRAGEGGYLIKEFERTGHAAIGWNEVGDMSDVQTLDDIRERVRQAYSDIKAGALGNSAAMAFKFRSVMQSGDAIVSFDTQKREYLLGSIVSEYEYKPGVISDYPHVRAVKWEGRVSRDALSPTSRNTLGSTLTLFEPGETVLADLRSALEAGGPTPQTEEEVEEASHKVSPDHLGRKIYLGLLRR